MASAWTWEDMSPGRRTGVERAQREPEGRCHSRAPRIEVPALERASHRQRAEAAVGGEGVTQEPYGQHLEANLQDRHARLKDQRYRPQPIRRVHIPKGQGKTRPRGLSACEDTLVQDAVRAVLDAMYAQDCWDCSQGFRPERRAHDAVRTLKRIVDRGEGGGIVEADMVSVFDSVDRTAWKKRREGRVAEGSRMRLIGKGWHVGVLDGEA